jgi:hypothetical protein
MDTPLTIILCRVVPGIRFKIVRVFSASGDELRILQRFQKSRFRSSFTIVWAMASLFSMINFCLIVCKDHGVLSPS